LILLAVIPSWGLGTLQDSATGGLQRLRCPVYNQVPETNMKGLAVIAGIVIVMLIFAGIFALYVMRLAGNR
jgi:hypothetical protein